MFLSAKTVLFLTAEQLQVSLWNGQRFTETHTFANHPSGQQGFADFLCQPRAPVLLLVDLIEEDFRYETLPHSKGANHRALIARKFERFYQHTSLRQARRLGRQSSGRRDDAMLFSALTNPQRINPCLDALRRSRTPLSGIFSVPGISAPLLKNNRAESCLLLTWERHAGLRQSYFYQRQLRFSRLTPLSAEQALVDSIAAEVPRTRQYLKSLDLPSATETLTVCVICHADDRPALQAQCQDSAEIKYIYQNIQSVSKNADSDASTLFLHLLLHAAPSNNYAQTIHLQDYRLWQWRMIAYGLALLALLLGLSLAALSLWQAQEQRRDNQEVLAQAARLRQQSLALRQRFPPTVIPADDMKMAVKVMHAFEHYFPAPERVLLKLSEAMSAFERIRLNKLSWQMLADPASAAPYPALQLVFEGELIGFANQQRAALAYLAQFQQHLNAQGYRVIAEKLPLNLSPSGTLQSELAQNTSPATFVLRLEWEQTK